MSDFLTVRTSSRSVLVIRMQSADRGDLVARCYDDDEATRVRRALAHQERRDHAAQRAEERQGVRA